MKLRFKFLIIFCILASLVHARDKAKYPVDEIPETLRANADAVIREALLSYEYQGIDKAVETQTMAITIFQESALSRSIFSEYYNKFTKISDIVIQVYDKDGNRVKKLDREDIRDLSAISGGSIYDDSRRKYADPKYTSYPFTVEYSFVRKYSSTYHFPTWYLVDGFNLAVQKSTFRVITPGSYRFRYFENNLNTSVIRQEAEGLTTYQWEVTNFKAFKYEPFAAPFEMWAPMVQTSPENFSIDGIEGSLDSWSDFGRFCSQLLIGKDNVPQATIDKVKSLLSDEMSDYEKISAIHGYAQEKNRYISIQDGLGGIQPYDAETVDRLSYGDCKALTNYTMSLIKALGYECYYTLVEAGRPSVIDPGFPKDYFNHVFLCVPLPGDTVWVECTNPYSPCGIKSDFTDDRYVFLVDNENSKLVRTPSFSAEENQQSINGLIQLTESGDAVASYSFFYHGSQYSDQLSLTLMDETDRKKQIIQSVNAPNFDLDHYKLMVEKGREPHIEKDVSLYLYDFCSKLGDKFIVKMNTINKHTSIPPYARGRKTPLYIPRNYSENDSIKIKLDASMAIDALPAPVEIESEFGSYKCHTAFDNDNISYIRHLEIKKGLYPKEKFNDFRDFLEKIAKADGSAAILKQKDS